MDDKKIDGRVRRTKKLLREGLISLMKKKSIKKISVRELSDLVEINRGTFYLHYKDIFDLVEQIENELFDEFEAIINQHLGKGENGPYAIILDSCKFLENNREICSVLLGDNGDIDFMAKLRKFISKKCFAEFSRNAKTISYREDYGYMYSFFESGVVGILSFWLADNSDNRKTPEEIAFLLNALFSRGCAGIEK